MKQNQKYECNEILKDDEQIEDLQLDGLKIIQNRSLYRFTSDAVILANFVRATPKNFVIDLCTGSGIIAILTAYKNKLKNVLGIEIQKELADMARRSVKFNKLESAIKIINCDIKNIKIQADNLKKSNSLFEFIPESITQKNESTLFLKKTADVIICNPPYKKMQNQETLKSNANNFESLDVKKVDSKILARHEVAIKMEEIIKVAYSLLKFGGKFYVIYDSERTAELIFKLKQYGLEPKKILFTQPKDNSNAILVLVEAVKGGKEGVKILPTLITNDKDGKYLEKIKNLKLNK
ncbi:MAG: methyltransferase [Clostridia bacterium]|nr:methyltransferase [Clostridia bacterium]